MFKIVNMSKVTECKASECAYNVEMACHAIAITVGDGNRPMCDTFFRTDMRKGVKGAAGVGACKVADCRHNSDYECGAPSIRVGNLVEAGGCLTFEPI